ncbi:MAG: prolyl oligopeptidase family serine peptidase [Nitrospirae bacterium]|nr:prolyl oligopeptidase family serine peptidase [Nitrospirota bacterium]
MSKPKQSFLLVCLLISILLISGNSASESNEKDNAYTASIMHNGLKRVYLIHVPPDNKNKQMPLVIALHGGGGTGSRMEKLTQGGFNALSDREGFIVVYPDGLEKHWNDGRSVKEAGWRAHKENADDVGFITVLIEHLVKEQNVDSKKVYITGVSNGALMSSRLACEKTEKITAIALVAGTIAENFAPRCSPSRPIPILMMHGTEDSFILWEGGEIAEKLPRGRKFGRTLSVPETVKFWVANNECSSPPIITQETDKDPKDNTRVRKEAYSDCKDGAEVILYAIENGGHTWPSGHKYLPERIVGRTSKDIDANEVIWDFFKRH